MKNLFLYFLPFFLIYSNLSFSQLEGQDYLNWAWGGKYSPYIEGTLGYGILNHSVLVGSFSNISTAELKLGYTELKNYKEYVQSLDERYLFTSYNSSNFLQFKDYKPGDINSTMWRFGIGNRLGFGYKIDAFSLIPYHQLQIVWTNVEWDSVSSNLSNEDLNILIRYPGGVRFGSSTEAGFKFYIAKTISIYAGLEASLIFQRHKVLHWSANYMLQAISYGAVSFFAETIVNSSPFFGPIMYFVLKNAIGFAWYYAMSDEMYWPISSETPLTMQTVKLGASFTF
ncbi:MAG: hypothetical protein R3250_10165 [Melioribacteraceae bacterium]|nr:hypothetical protein [Melioribacteraceae bacterium]